MRDYVVEEEIEDVTGLTGWMYTDLFVGLMVIFLATITFIPAGKIFVDKNAVQTYSQIYPTPLAMRYQGFSAPKILKDINDFTMKQGITNGASVAQLRIVGAYNPNTETQDVAYQRALEFSRKLSSINSEWFKNSVTTIQTTADAQVENIVVEYTFSQLIQVLPAP
jgi:hypothetical protein